MMVRVGRLGGEMASMAKYWVTDLENKVAADCLQVWEKGEGGRREEGGGRSDIFFIASWWLGLHVGDQDCQSLRQRQNSGKKSLLFDIF